MVARWEKYAKEEDDKLKITRKKQTNKAKAISECPGVRNFTLSYRHEEEK